MISTGAEFFLWGAGGRIDRLSAELSSDTWKVLGAVWIDLESFDRAPAGCGALAFPGKN
jgi:hypothetical protein